MNKLSLLFSLLILPYLGYSQCMDADAHNTSLNSMWLSCETSPNPLGALGNNHWILYEFDEVKSVDELTVWNSNHPEYLEAGIKTLRIDFSSDGATWFELGITDLERGEGSLDYTGMDLDIEAFEAKFVLMTAIDNFGGDCTGLSEVRFTLGDFSTATEDTFLSSLISVSPNPADQYVDVAFGDIPTDRISYQIVDASGRVLLRELTDVSLIRDGLTLSTTELPDGQYTLQLQTDIGTAAKQIIVLHTK